MQNVLYILGSGFVATLGMVIVMTITYKLKIANADMVRAIGSSITKSEDNAKLPGFLVHFTNGMLFAFAYAALLGIFSTSGFVLSLMFGGAAGFFHGVVASFIIVTIVAQNHPIEKYRDFGLQVAAAHVVGHVVYGVLVSLLLYSTKVRLVLHTSSG